MWGIRMTFGKPLAQPRQSGFTLLELLLALAIFTILSTLAYGGLKQLLNQQQQLQQRQQRLQQIQTTMQLLERDLSQLVARPIRDAYGDSQPALKATASNTGSVDLSVRRPYHPNRPQASLLQRAGYHHHDQQLLRHYWPRLDITQATRRRQYPLLDQVSQVQWRFMQTDGQWLTYWPPAGAARDSLPRATEIIVTTTDYGPIRRVIIGPGGLP